MVMLTGGLDEDDRIAMPLVVVEARDQMVKGGGEAHGSSPPCSVTCAGSIGTLRGYLEEISPLLVVLVTRLSETPSWYAGSRTAPARPGPP